MSQLAEWRNIDQLAARTCDLAACLPQFDWHFVATAALNEVLGHGIWILLVLLVLAIVEGSHLGEVDPVCVNYWRQRGCGQAIRWGFADGENRSHRGGIGAIGYAYRTDFLRCAYGLGFSAA